MTLSERFMAKVDTTNTYTGRGHRECRSCNRERASARYHDMRRHLERRDRFSNPAPVRLAGDMGVAA